MPACVDCVIDLRIVHALSDDALFVEHPLGSHAMTGRILERAVALAKSGTIVRRGNIFTVPAQSKPKASYFVNLANERRPRCGCTYWIKTGRTCKHITAARIVLERERSVIDEIPVTKHEIQRFPRDWELYNRAEVSAPRLAIRVLRFLALQLPEFVNGA
jgi:uncharacterized Zn finger protein